MPVNVMSDMKLLGIDVSAYQQYKGGPINWFMAKSAGVDFAIIKVIRKDLNPDKEFENNWQGCLDAGVPIQGVYNYTYATSIKKARKDAQAVLGILGANRHPMVWLDYEWANLPKGRLAADIINAYGDVITAGGCRYGIYFGMSYYNMYLDDIISHVRPEYRIGWEARYYNGYKKMTLQSPVDQSKCPDNFDGTLYGWQYSSFGEIPGITGNVDLDMWYVSIEAEKVEVPEEKAEYRLQDFILNSRDIWGVTPTASAREIVDKTRTVSVYENSSHPIVTELERHMKALGYYTGAIEADSNREPLFGNGMKKATILYQANDVKAIKKYQDGELTARGATWKRLYGCN